MPMHLQCHHYQDLYGKVFSFIKPLSEFERIYNGFEYLPTHEWQEHDLMRERDEEMIIEMNYDHFSNLSKEDADDLFNSYFEELKNYGIDSEMLRDTKENIRKE